MSISNQYRRFAGRFLSQPGLARYCIAAGACLALHNLILIAGDWIGLGVLPAALLSFVVLAVVGFLLLSRFAFCCSANWQGFLRYCMAMATNFPLSTGVIWLLVEPLGQPMARAAPASSVIMIVINYTGSRWAILGRRKSLSASA